MRHAPVLTGPAPTGFAFSRRTDYSNYCRAAFSVPTTDASTIVRLFS